MQANKNDTKIPTAVSEKPIDLGHKNPPWQPSCTKNENAFSLVDSIKSFEVVQTLTPFVHRAGLLRAVGIRMVMSPEVFDVLMKMGEEGQAIALKALIIHDSVVYKHADWNDRCKKIASGEWGPQGEKPNASTALINKLVRLIRSLFSFDKKAV